MLEVKLTIGDLARQAGVRTSALRYYESVGLLAPPTRVNGRRVYDASAIDVLKLIQLAKGAGFSMAEIRRLLNGFDRATPASARWQAMATRKLEDVNALIERAEHMRGLLRKLLTCQCVQLAECVRPRRA
ncbi:MAG TPA: MerR family transcriptional regulator [Gemmatimonadaceae bacterium]|jgi:MerR family redox-sensitive transcriptional activator SoxR|nr:MerR family transcriptional regulator [Gemmatimonadaceae bacterium]